MISKFRIWRQTSKIFKLIQAVGYTYEITYEGDKRCPLCREYSYLLREVKHSISPAGEHFKNKGKIICIFCARCWHISHRVKETTYSTSYVDTSDKNSNLIEYIFENNQSNKALRIIESALELSRNNLVRLTNTLLPLLEEKALVDNSPYRGCLGPAENPNV